MTPHELTFHPLTTARWPHLEKLFGEHGAAGGCWCMWWRLKSSDFNAMKGDQNKAALRGIVENGGVPGLLAYDGDDPIGWCSLAPRPDYVRLETSRILKPVDEQPVWSIVCFYVAKSHRRQGVSVKLLKAAIDYAREQGASILEGYPMEPKDEKMPDTFAWYGIASAFIVAGFTEVARRSETRTIMRYFIDS
jgi:GNAT superfamily N-acetyltransferase